MSQSVAGELELARNALADEYDVLDEIGRGGMAIVFRARDKALDRDVAIKVLPPAMAFDAAFVERFQREARTAAQLEHPNIVPIYRVGQAGVGPSQVIYIVMKQLRGESLASLLAARGTLPPEEIRAVLRDTAQALAYASRRGVVHRDIKPDNILYDDDRWVLADFGIAKSMAARSLTQSGTAVGTPRYMSPEQARAKPLDVRADIYSLGIVAYQCLVGHVPFDGDDGFAILYDHVTTEMPIPPLANDDERALYAIIRQMTEKHLDNRVSDGDALLRLLDVPMRLTPSMSLAAIPMVDVGQRTPVKTLSAPQLKALTEGPTAPIVAPSSVSTPIVTAPTGLRAFTEGPTMPLAPSEPYTSTPPGKRPWRRWARWTVEAWVLIVGLGVLLTRDHAPPPVARHALAPAAVKTTLPVLLPDTLATPAPPPVVFAPVAAPPVAAPPAKPAPTPTATKSRCGGTSPFGLRVDPIPATRYRHDPFELSYDVCGLESGARYSVVVTTQRRTSAIGKLLGGGGVTTEKLDERATGRTSHLRIGFASFAALKPGEYTIKVTVTDQKGRTRDQTGWFDVVNRPDAAAQHRSAE
jgi:serine/threonine protein kinase